MTKTHVIAIVSLCLVGLLILLVSVPLLFSLFRGSAWGCVTGDCSGMMGYLWHRSGMMGRWSFGPCGLLSGLIGLMIPLGLLALLAGGGVWLFRLATQRPGVEAVPHPVSQGDSCSNCGRPTQPDWQLCPYCSQSLV